LTWATEWGTTADSILSEVRRWRRKPGAYLWRGKEFASFEAALLELDPRLSPQGKKTKSHGVTFPMWRETFILAYRDTFGNRKLAADAAGIPWETARKRLDPKSAEFDAVFAEMVEEEDAVVAEKARSGAHHALDQLRHHSEATWNDPREGTKAAAAHGRHALEILERRAPGWSRSQRVEVSGTVMHAALEIREEATSRAVEISHSVAVLPAAPSPASLDIVEGELVGEVVR
jgi:hypothetical protein